MVVSEEDLKTAATRYFYPPEVNEQNLPKLFPYHRDREIHTGWTVNRVIWVCHNCGAMGYKLGSTNPNFKCYHCSSANVTVCRAGEISIVVRQMQIGINMEEVRSIRKSIQQTRKNKLREIKATLSTST
jgi:hypothetical protein